ncbi:unnamed protein product, partial [Effrenium voratum]
ELGDTREISVSDFLGLLFDKVPASATGMDQNEKPQATSTEAAQLGTAQAYAALPTQELHQELPPLAPELHGESPEVQAESDEAAPKLPSTEDAEDSARKSSETKLDEVVFTDTDGDVVLLQLAGNHVRLLVNGKLKLEQVERFEIDVAQRTFEIEFEQVEFQDEEDVPKIQEQVERLFDRAAKALLLKPPAPEASEPGHVHQADREAVLAAVRKNHRAQFASEELQADLEVVLAALAKDYRPLQFASQELRGDREFVLAAVAQDGYALQLAAEELREDQAFVLEAVEKTRSWFLVNWAGPELREDKDFLQKCKDVCGTGLIFTYYESFTAFQSMRKSFLATGASVPGGQAYERVMEKLRERGDKGAATVWFDKEPVFGASADDGRWLHPSEECGRDYKPVPPESPGRHPMWRSKVESSTADSIPEVGSKHPCWCCHWIRKVRERHAAGAVICCTVSNIFSSDWVGRYGAGSSELTDQRADELNLPRECFKNGRPEGWGCGKITIHGADTFEREAPIHPRTGLPLGQGCRWERQALDGMDFPVYVFFIP